MKRSIVALLTMICAIMSSYAQMTFGNSGLVNIPTADMKDEGTFLGGATFLPKHYMSSTSFGYVTGIYYFGFTPFDWVELTLRQTLLKAHKLSDEGVGGIGYYQQDRSYSVRLRPLKEKDGKWWPNIVIGTNDPWSDNGGSYYSCIYGVVTKHVKFDKAGDLGLTAGYFHKLHDRFGENKAFDGVFGGVSFTPRFWDKMTIAADYDTHGVNLGVNVCLFNHWNILGYGRDLSKFGFGMSYQYTIDW